MYKKYLSLILIVMMLISSLSVFSYADTETKEQGNHTDKFDKSLISAMDKEDRIDVIVHMAEKADLEEAKREALDKRFGETEIIERKAVIGALEETAKSSQADLLEFLDKEKQKGRVYSYESFFIINAVRVEADNAIIKELSKRDDIKKITLNKKIKQDKPIIPENKNIFAARGLSQEEQIEWNIKAIGADRVWKDFGVQGENVTVGIIDTGVYVGNPAIHEKWRGYDKITKTQKTKGNYVDYIEGKAFPDPTPANNHGTHVAGTILGEMTRNTGEKYNRIGVAPGAKFISARAFDDFGGRHDTILKCAEWMLKPGGKAEDAPDIVNNSWGGSNNIDPWFKDVINVWRKANIFPVFAAGNLTNFEIQQAGTITNPGSLKEAFAVGAVNSDNKIATFSKWGPSLFPDAKDRYKPEIVAPGVQIRSGLANGGFASWNGTSMATPHIAGVVALMKSASPNLKVDEIEKILKETALPLKDNMFKESPNMAYGYGLVSAYDAVAAVMGKGVGTVSGNVTTRGNDVKEPEISLEIEKTVFKGRDFKIKAHIKDDVSVVKAKAAYSNDAGQIWKEEDLELVEGDSKSGQYKAVIKADQINGSDLQLKIRVWDYGRKDSDAKETPAQNIPVKEGINPGKYRNDFEQEVDGWQFDGIWNWGKPVSHKEPEPKNGEKYVGTAVGEEKFPLRVNSFLTMPPIDISKHHDKKVLLKYDEFLGTDPATYCAIEIKTDGGDFTEIATRERGTEEKKWKEITYDLSKYVKSGNIMELRFKLQGPPKDEGPGWYIDNVQLTGETVNTIGKVNGIKLKNMSDGVRITWDESNDPIVTGYKIFRKIDGENEWKNLQHISDKEKTVFTDPIKNDGKYYYKIIAVDDYGNESDGEAVKINFEKLDNIFHSNLQEDNGGLKAEGSWQWGVPVKTSGNDPYSTVYYNEQGLFNKIKDADKVWGTILKGALQPREFAVLETQEIQIPDAMKNPVLEFESYNTIPFSSLSSNIHFKVEINTTGNTWTEIISPFIIMEEENKNKWNDVIADLNSYKGKTVKIRWVSDTLKVAKTDKYELGWYVDNIRIGEKVKNINMSADGNIAVPKTASLGESDDFTETLNSNKIVLFARGPAGIRSGFIPLKAKVTVKETGKKVISNPADGSYTFHHAETGDEMWTVIAEAYGYFTKEIKIDLKKGQTKNVDFELEPKGKGGIRGKIFDENGFAIENAYVRLLEDSNYPISKTDSKGEFAIDSVYEGEYKLRAFKKGYYGKTINVNVQTTKTTEPNITLEKHENGWKNELLNVDNGNYSKQYIHHRVADGPKGYAVRYRPDKKGGMVVSASIYVPESKSQNKMMDILVMGYDEDGRLVELGKEENHAMVPNQWNEIQLAGHNIKTDKSFYLIALQKVSGPDTVTVGIDNSDDAMKPGALNSYIYNGAFSKLSTTGINGALMMRCNMRFPENAESNPEDPNELDAESAGSTPIIAPDEEDAFIFEEGEYENSGVTGYIKGYKGHSKNIVIPTSIRGKTVKAIGADVFRDKNIKNVKLPQKVEIIGKNAFYNNYIESIELPESLKAIHEEAFSGNLIKEINVPDNVMEIGRGAFSKNVISKVTGMKNIRKIPERAFFLNGRIEMEIPEVREIADDAFGPKSESREYALLTTSEGNKYNLKSKDGAYIINPAKIIMNLYDVEVKKFIKEGIEIIGDDGTGKTPKDYLNVNPVSNYYTVDGRTVSIKAPRVKGYANLHVSKNVVLDSALKSIKFDYSDIELMLRGPIIEGDKEIVAIGAAGIQVEIVKNGDKIGIGKVDEDGYFDYAVSGLKTGDKIKFITRDDAGNEYTSQEYEVQPEPKNQGGSIENLFVIDKQGFLMRYLGKEKNLVIPSSINRRTIKKIAPLVFYNMGIETVDFSNNTGLDEIGNGAFARNKLQTISFPNGMLHYGKKSFEYNELKNVQLSPHAHLINERAFHANKIREIGIPGTVAHIRPGAFMDNLIESVILPKRLESVESYAFANNNLTSVVFDIPAKGEVTGADEPFEKLEEGVFMGNNLTEVKIPDTVKEIANNAFSKNGRVVNLIIDGKEPENADFAVAGDFGHMTNGVKIKFVYKNTAGKEIAPGETLVGAGLKERTDVDLSKYFKAGENVKIQPKAINGIESKTLNLHLKTGITNEVEVIYGDNPGAGGSSAGIAGSIEKTEKKKDKDEDIKSDEDLGKKFIDIQNHWAKDFIYHTLKNRYFNGTASNKFSPDNHMSRGGVVTVLGRMTGVKVDEFKDSGLRVFSDIAGNTYYAPYARWAYQSKIVKGFGDGTFRAERQITRQELAVMLNAFIENTGIEFAGYDKNNKAYKDFYMIKNWAKYSVVKLTENGILNGDANGYFKPVNYITRAEFATILFNIDNKRKKF